MAEDVRDLALLLHSLTQKLHLSPACAAGIHTDCPGVDSYRGLPCCCPECDHADLTGTPPPVCRPLLHLAEEGRQRRGYIYNGQCLGVRADLYEKLERVLELHVHQLRRPKVAYDLAVAAALLFAPRSGA